MFRGGTSGPNYSPVHVESVAKRISKTSNPHILPPSIVVDASHGNSGKDHNKQPLVIDAICNQVARGQTAITGVMMESFLEAGAQKLIPG